MTRSWFFFFFLSLPLFILPTFFLSFVLSLFFFTLIILYKYIFLILPSHLSYISILHFSLFLLLLSLPLGIYFFTFSFWLFSYFPSLKCNFIIIIFVIIFIHFHSLPFLYFLWFKLTLPSFNSRHHSLLPPFYLCFTYYSLFCYLSFSSSLRISLSLFFFTFPSSPSSAQHRLCTTYKI